MKAIHYQPHIKYRAKLFLVFGLIGLLSLVFVSFIALAIGSEEGGVGGAMLGLFIAFALEALWLVPAFFLISPYYRSLQYEIHEDEVIVRVGVITKTVKHVPFRTVTNLTVKQDPFDRVLGIGTLNIQTAGMSGQTGAEESLVGLPNFQEVYEQVAGALRRFRGGMAPTQTEDEGMVSDASVLSALLDEVRAIRETISSNPPAIE